MNQEKQSKPVKNVKAKKILGIIGNVIIWVFVVFSLVVTIMTFSSLNSEDGMPSIFGASPVSVLSDSMKPEFKEGDMIICKKVTEEQRLTLKAKSDTYEGDVITFKIKADVNGDGEQEEVFNTHRIIAVRDDGGNIYYTTKGDNNSMEDTNELHYTEVLAIWTGAKFGGLGGFLGFLRTPTGFLVVIVIPLILFFLYELYVVISTLVAAKAKKAVAVDEEEIKRRAIEEYLRSQGQPIPDNNADKAKEEEKEAADADAGEEESKEADSKDDE